MNSILNKVLISFAALFLFAPIVNASVVINEIQISPINERFIELYNPDNSDTDLTGWYIQRKTATGASFSSLVTSTQLNNKIIKSHGYFLISRSQLGNSDVVVDNLTLTEANTIRIRDSKGKDVDQIEWETIDEGKSYQRVLTGEWVIATSTPRAVNSRAESTSTSSTQTSGTNPAPVNSEPPSSASNSSWPVEQQIFANAGPDKTATVGADMVFEGKALGLEKSR